MYQDITTGIQNNPDHYRSLEHVARTVYRQAVRELRKSSQFGGPASGRTNRQSRVKNPVTFGFSDATTLGRDGFSRCDDPLDAAIRAERVGRVEAWLAARPAGDRVLMRVLAGELTKSAAGEILEIHASTIARRCDTLLLTARRDLMEKTS